MQIFIDVKLGSSIWWFSSPKTFTKFPQVCFLFVINIPFQTLVWQNNRLLFISFCLLSFWLFAMPTFSVTYKVLLTLKLFVWPTCLSLGGDPKICVIRIWIGLVLIVGCGIFPVVASYLHNAIKSSAEVLVYFPQNILPSGKPLIYTEHHLEYLIQRKSSQGWGSLLDS